MYDYLPIDIAASGMLAERLRMNAIASNLANVNSTRTPEGGPYKPLDVIFHTEHTASFQKILAQEMGTFLGQEFSSEDQALLALHLRGVSARIVPSGVAPELRHDPEHPDADADGNVAYPSISPIEQMTNMIAASRAYEANAAVIKMTTEMLEEVLVSLR